MTSPKPKVENDDNNQESSDENSTEIETTDTINAPDILTLRVGQRPFVIIDQLEEMDARGFAVYQIDQGSPYDNGYTAFRKLADTTDLAYRPVRKVIDMYIDIKEKYKESTDQSELFLLGQIKTLILDILECRRTIFTVAKYRMGGHEQILLYMDVHGRRSGIPDLTVEKRSDGEKVIHFSNSSGSQMYWYSENSKGSELSVSTPICSGLFSLNLRYRSSIPGEPLVLGDISGTLNESNTWTDKQKALVFQKDDLDETKVDFDKIVGEILRRWPYDKSKINLPGFRFSKHDLLFRHDFSHFHGDAQRNLPSRSFHTVLLEGDENKLLAINFDTETGYPFETTILIDNYGETPVETITGESMGTTITGKVIVRNGFEEIEIPIQEEVLLDSNEYLKGKLHTLAAQLAKIAFEKDPTIVPPPKK